MRFVSRVLIGATAAAVLAVGAPAAAHASAAPTAAPATASSSYYEAEWGEYSSSDHRARAEGHVSVDKKKYKKWDWKYVWKKYKVCKYNKHGDKVCKWYKKKVKHHFWTWAYAYPYTVDSTLTNYKWWGKKWWNKKKYPCAWETFKVVGFDNSTSYKSFRNCHKGEADYSFEGKDAKHIYVDVSRGNWKEPKGYHSGWKPVYQAS